jgi:glutamate N-acetyltransferase/amino-acid N-acetyltransferase
MMWPQGFRSAGVTCGIKASGESDLGVILADAPVVWSGTFTKNAAAAPSVHWSRSRRDGDVRAIVVNSGNANACAGTAGEQAVRETVVAAAQTIGCVPEEILVASTGPIGIPLPADKVAAALPDALRALAGSPESFARSIMTTDTKMKIATWTGPATIVGVAKGAAMLAPNMATMLAFIATDARIGRGDLDRLLTAAVARTFDRICVDACESTNDSVFCLASGAREVDLEGFGRGLEQVCGDLALQMVGDAEGSTKLLRIRVSGATDESAAVALGRAVAGSALWRAAVHGADPNWGRVLAALGSIDRTLDLAQVRLALGDTVVFRGGEPVPGNGAAHAAMRSDEVVLTCVVGDGQGAAEILSTDLTPAYVTLNAEGST